jgi:phage RecT family recombinase
MPNELTILEAQFAPLTTRFDSVLKAPGVDMDTARLIASVMTACDKNHLLLEANRQSLINAAMTAAWLGLPCDGMTGQAFLVPYKGKRGGSIVQLIIGYKGYNTLAARGGITITGEVVRAGDEFDFDMGQGEVRHRFDLQTPRGPIIGAWSKASAKDRPPALKVLTLADILEIKAKSPRGNEAPWADPHVGFPAMAEKSAKRRLARVLPLMFQSPFALAARIEEAYEEQNANAWIDEKGALQIEHGGAVIDNQPSLGGLTGTVGPDGDNAGPDQHDQDGVVLPPQHTVLSSKPTDATLEWRTKLQTAANNGMEALRQEWKRVPFRFHRILVDELNATWKPIAIKSDAAEMGEPDVTPENPSPAPDPQDPPQHTEQ